MDSLLFLQAYCRRARTRCRTDRRSGYRLGECIFRREEAACFGHGTAAPGARQQPPGERIDLFSDELKARQYAQGSARGHRAGAERLDDAELGRLGRCLVQPLSGCGDLDRRRRNLDRAGDHVGHDLGRTVQRVLRQMRITLCGARLRVPEKPLHDIEGYAFIDEKARKGMPQVVQPEVIESGSLLDPGPRKVERGAGAAGDRRGEYVGVAVHARDRSQQRHGVAVQCIDAWLAGFGDGHQRGAPLPVDVVPLRVRDLVAPCAGEQRHHDGLRGASIFVDIVEAISLLVCISVEKAVALHVRSGIEPRGGIFANACDLPLARQVEDEADAGSAPDWSCRSHSPCRAFAG